MWCFWNVGDWMWGSEGTVGWVEKMVDGGG